MSIVSTKVTVRTARCTSPVRQTDRRSSGLIVRKPMRISSPASAGMAMLAITPPNATMTTAITNPGDDQRLAGTGAGGLVQRRRGYRAAHGHPLEDAGGDVGDALADEVL